MRCLVAERETNGEWWCSRAAGHTGPCAARQMRRQRPEERAFKIVLAPYGFRWLATIWRGFSFTHCTGGTMASALRGALAAYRRARRERRQAAKRSQ